MKNLLSFFIKIWAPYLALHAHYSCRYGLGGWVRSLRSLFAHPTTQTVSGLRTWATFRSSGRDTKRFKMEQPFFKMQRNIACFCLAAVFLACSFQVQAQSGEEVLETVFKKFQSCTSCKYDFDISTFDLKGNVTDNTKVTFFIQDNTIAQTTKGITFIVEPKHIVQVNTNDKSIRFTPNLDKKRKDDNFLQGLALLAGLQGNWTVSKISDQQSCVTSIFSNSAYRTVKVFYSTKMAIELIVIETNEWNPNYGIWQHVGSVSYTIKTLQGSSEKPVFSANDFYTKTKTGIVPVGKCAGFRVL